MVKVFKNLYGNATYVMFTIIPEHLNNNKRRLSYWAFIGALMTSLNRDKPGFSLPCQIISLLTEIDNLIMEWRRKYADKTNKHSFISFLRVTHKTSTLTLAPSTRCIINARQHRDAKIYKLFLFS